MSVLLALGLAFADSSTLEGPGRFCGHAPIIDLLGGERVITLEAGIHSGSFRWEGAFGQLEVYGIGWASPPKGAGPARRTSRGHLLFPARREGGRYQVALWNGRQGVAYFSTPRRPTHQQLAAIDRVDLFQEGEEPEGCKLRTALVWME